MTKPRDPVPHRPRILVVDDERQNRALMEVMLTPEGFRLMTASSGEEALAMVAEQPPDLILLDIMMPEVNGFAVVEALKEHPETARIPILVVTAKRITAEDRAKLKDYVAAILETAALDRDQIRAEIRRAMSGRSVVT